MRGWRRLVVAGVAVQVGLMLLHRPGEERNKAGELKTFVSKPSQQQQQQQQGNKNENKSAVPRSALARQYAMLTRLGQPPRALSASQVFAYERRKARYHAMAWFRRSRRLLERCERAKALRRSEIADEVANFTEEELDDLSKVRWFVVSDRKDFSGFVREELLELGLCEAPLNESHARLDFYVGEQFESENGPSWARRIYDLVASENASVGAIDGLMAGFGSKESYANLFWYCKELSKEMHDRRVLCPAAWLPAFNVFGDENRRSVGFRTGRITASDVPHFKGLYDLVRGARPPTWWIVKPQKGTFLSQGMHLSQLAKADVNSEASLLDWISANVVEPSCRERYDPHKCDRRLVTFQIYVHKPALFHGRKFDVRLWFAMTSVDPLRVFLLRHGYPKVSSRAYVPRDLDDQCVHIKMLLDPECNVTTRQFKDAFPFGFPRSTASPVFFQGLEFPGLRESAPSSYNPREMSRSSYRTDRRRPRDWPVKEQFWSRRVWPSIEAAVSRVVMLARSKLAAASAQNGPRSSRSSSRKAAAAFRVFSLLSPDVTLDDKGRVYVEEINTNGLMMGTHANLGGSGNLFFDDSYVKSLLQIVGADAYPNASAYQANLDRAIDAFCDKTEEEEEEESLHCSSLERDELARAVHEEAHAGNHWYRVYPPIACFERADLDRCKLASDQTTRAWPNQATFSASDLRAVRETPLDIIVRRFLATTDTELIHGVPQVPGHARWPPREFDATSSI
ncbi:hypothetical protein CTAYLR_005325 [Chrysophaeum taylorii]|uniref:Uncharacterized protein n=1 Tax=Chrysophaeum taylorii TaxID=2483200 RepID=A0AAD7U6W4_9STRA|nr:hypothetical protein CTAYLR_005325 [Chrysophaeum taylorii]